MLDWTFQSPLGCGRPRREPCCCGLSRSSPALLVGAPTSGSCATRSAASTGDAAAGPGPTRAYVPTAHPFVSLHVPAHNEPPEMVIETADARCCASTTRTSRSSSSTTTPTDESLWRPVETWCAEQRRHVRAPRRLARLQVRRAQLRPRASSPTRGPRSSASSTPTTRSTRTSCARCAPLFADPERRVRADAAGLPRLGASRRSTGGSTTPTSTSSRSRSRPATSATARSSPGRWA